MRRARDLVVGVVYAMLTGRVPGVKYYSRGQIAVMQYRELQEINARLERLEKRGV